jgi:hypothetical protein
VTTPELPVWKALPRPVSQGDSLHARPAVPEVDGRLLAAMDAAGIRHILVRLPPSAPEHQDHQTRGLKVQTREMRVEGAETGRYIDVACSDAAGHAALDIVARELALGLSIGAGDVGTIVSRVLAKWRRFWGSAASGLLSPNEQLGLFGELWFLATWLIPEVGSSAVFSWCGPRGARHDFQALGLSVEVKTTLSTRPVHRISGLDQLAVPEGGELLFMSVQLREEPSAANSLGALIEHLLHALKDDAEAQDHLEAELARLGVSGLLLPEYKRANYRIAGESLYLVGAGFPRLIRSSLVADQLPAGVEALEYDITLQGAAGVRLDRDSSPAKARLQKLGRQRAE